jgi:hypothetical protein
VSIDAALGRLGNKSGVCTSSTRPTNPFEGQLIYETDTNRTLVYDNAAWLVVADNQVLSIDSANSRVGIGATNPARPLEVDGGPVGIAATFKSTNATGGISLMGSGTTDDTRVRIGAEGDDLKLFSNNIERVRIDSSGNVGINDTTPSYKLDVDGDINATGDLRVGGTAIGEWTSYTPTLTNFTGTFNFAVYAVVNKIVIVHASIELTSTVTGIMEISAPVNFSTLGGTGAGQVPIGWAHGIDSSLSSGRYSMFVASRGTNVFRFMDTVPDTFTNQLANATQPFTWASGDFIRFTATYKGA